MRHLRSVLASVCACALVCCAGAAEAPAARPLPDALARLAAEPWIGDGRPAFANEADFYGEDPAPSFSATCTLPEGTGDVALYVACAGYCDVRLNGKRPLRASGPMPLWSPYDHTIYVERLVFAPEVREDGKKTGTIGVTLGNGFYNLPPLKFWGVRRFRDALAHGRPCFKLIVDGAPQALAWRWRNSRIIRNCVYLGEEVDRARAGDAVWKPAAVVNGPKGRLVLRKSPAMIARPAVPGKARWLKKGSVQVVDFGVNATGVPRFVFSGQKKGQRIEIVYGERLNADGSVNVLTQTAGQIKRGQGGDGAPHLACQRDVYVYGAGDCKGEGLGAEVFSPRFVWHVCRYAEVRGCDRLLDEPSRATFHVLAPALRDSVAAATFHTSNPDLAKIHEICRRTFLANAIGGVQSDCPGRERLGYGGDLAATCEAFILNWDMREFYLKVLQDFADEAADDGWLTETAPFVGIADRGFGGRSGPMSFSVALPVVMDALLRHYPDIRDRVLAHYPVCARYVRLVDAKFPDGLIPHCIGDHEALERAPDGVTATVHWHAFASLTAKFARLVGRADEARAFAAIAEKVKRAFVARYVKDGVVANGTQSAQALALYWGLVPADQVAAAELALVKAVEAKGCAPSTGIFATRCLLMYLSEHGRRDLAEKIVLHRGFPGWLHMIERGATTLWETWKESDDIFSNCHPMFGSVDEWILKYAKRGPLP